MTRFDDLYLWRPDPLDHIADHCDSSAKVGAGLALECQLVPLVLRPGKLPNQRIIEELGANLVEHWVVFGFGRLGMRFG